MIERDKEDKGSESWHGKAIVSQTELRAMIKERAKSGPIHVNEPILAEFHKGKTVYSGLLLVCSFPDPVDSNPSSVRPSRSIRNRYVVNFCQTLPDSLPQPCLTLRVWFEEISCTYQAAGLFGKKRLKRITEAAEPLLPAVPSL
jgi:hypothetical protein